MSNPLFPSTQTGAVTDSAQPVSTSNEISSSPVVFSSFQPPPSTTNLAELLSSSEDESPKKRHPSSDSKPRESKRRKMDQADDFYIDRKGDPSNLSYQGLYRMDVAAYRPQKLTSLLTAYTQWNGNYIDRYFSPKQVVCQRSRKFQRLKMTGRKKIADSDESCMVLVRPDSEEDLVESIEEELLRKTREFNMNLRKTPHDLELWKQFAEFQDEVVALTKRRVSVASLAEKKISILAGALRHHPANEDLLSQLVKLNATITPPAEAQEKFESLLARLPSSLKIWETYIAHLKSSFTDFSCDKLRAVYQGCLKGVEDGIKTKSSLVVKSDQAEEELVLAFLLGVQFDLQSGFEEKALSKMQVALEWVFCAPSNKSSLSEESLQDLFQRFWENEDVPKLGESGAKGFGDFVENKIFSDIQPRQPGRILSEQSLPAQAEIPADRWSGWFEVGEGESLEEEIEEEEEVEEVEEEDLETEEDLLRELGMKLEEVESAKTVTKETFERFFLTEELRSDEEVLPKRRPSAEHPDLDRVVLFEELQPLIFELEEPQRKKKLLLGIFALLEIDTTELVCSEDAFFRSLENQVESTPLWIRRGILKKIPSSGKLTPWFLRDPVRGDFALQLVEYFAVELFPSDLRIRKLWIQTAWDIHQRFHPSTELAALGKSILGKYRTDLNLWSAYGAIVGRERQPQGRKVWNGVFQMLLSMNGADSTVLACSLVQEALNSTEMDPNCLHLLGYVATEDVRFLRLYLAGDQQWSPEVDQVCCRYFQNRVVTVMMSKELSWEDYDVLICAAYFYGLSASTKSPPFALHQVFATAGQWLRSQLAAFARQKTRQIEALHEQCCAWYCAAGIAPKALKTEIFKGLEVFPNSRKLLLQLMELHVASRTISSLLIDMKTHVFRSLTVGGATLVLYLEELRSLQSFSVPNLFERVVKLEDGNVAFSPLIWRLFISFSCQNEEIIKRTFLRAIRACPWNKAIWLEGLQVCQQIMTGTELSEFLETMKEKGIRLRTDIYEILLEQVA